jgi:dihydrolipoamide dehydrogenase
VIGAGVIGLELGSVWRRLGAEVIMLEALETFLAIADQQLAQEAAAAVQEAGLDIRSAPRSPVLRSAGGSVTVSTATRRAQILSLSADQVIVAVGRRPYTTNLFAADSGVVLDERGFIQVDESVPNRRP